MLVAKGGLENTRTIAETGDAFMNKRLAILLLLFFFVFLPLSVFAFVFENELSDFAFHVFSSASASGSAFSGSQRMSDLSIQKDGDGYYTFGKHLRDGRHWNRMNFWYPYKSYSHEMTTTLEKGHISPEQLISDLNKEADENGNIEIAFWLDHQDAMLEDCIRDFMKAVGTDNFAISIIYSTNTHNISFYVNVDSNASHDTIHKTTLIKVLKDNIRHVIAADPDAFPKHGHEIRDHFSVSFGKPLIVVYLLGTGDLYFH